MVATIDRTRITREELAEGEQQLAQIQHELELARVKAADAVSEAAKRWNSVHAQEYAHETARDVTNLTRRANDLARFLQSVEVDPDPEPTPPAAPADRPVGTIERDRRVITARQYGSCRCCQQGIAPGQRITSTFVAGCWAHEGCWERDIAQRKAASEDRKLGALFAAFIERLPQAVAA